MGPMGPIGPMMGGGVWGGGAVTGPLLALLVLLILAVGLAALALGYGRARAERRPRSPEAILRDRYARGQLTRAQYSEALVDLLKDRYVRGEIDLDEYEARLDRLLVDQRPRLERAPIQARAARPRGAAPSTTRGG